LMVIGQKISRNDILEAYTAEHVYKQYLCVAQIGLMFSKC